MRPQILNPLFAPLDSIKGIGAKTSKAYANIGCTKVLDLLFHLPSSTIIRTPYRDIDTASPGEVVILKGEITEHKPNFSPKTPYKVIIDINGIDMELVFFNYKKEYLENTLPTGKEMVISGKLERFNNRWQVTHPDYIMDSAAKIPLVEPVYPLTAGISNRMMQSHVAIALERLPSLPEWIDPHLIKEMNLPSFKEALSTVHHPKSPEDIDSIARQRLAYDELFAGQLALISARKYLKKIKGTSINGNGELARLLYKKLPFHLTSSQIAAIKEIRDDMAQPYRMLRLLQGDVGSGKTVVALFAALNAIECGYQAAIMAPTEILARQHFDTISALAVKIDVKVSVLTGRDKGKIRERLLASIANGKTNIIIGTHALFQEDVIYKDLRFIVIDEQHRFGVEQRLKLAEKGNKSDILVMSATPIPRTLVMTAYGDMDNSRLTEKPAGRKPIKTVAIPNNRINEVVQALQRALSDGNKVYWICPLVEETEKSDLAAAKERFQDLQQIFGDRTGLVHGKMKSSEKDSVMDAFDKGNIDILVATTVVEVGVDVKGATVMVIEHSERFGLAQLHQLRGRIGRNDRNSHLILMYADRLTDTARERLKIIRESQDGFLIAEKDLELRGAGDILGTKQSGIPEFKMADLTIHTKLLEIARRDAIACTDPDPYFNTKRGEALKTLLHLFGHDIRTSNTALF